MKAKEGDTVRSVLSGLCYKVRKVANHIAVLESQDGKCQILTELDTLGAFYQEKEDLERSNKT
jgi:hypothetical protein